jgi:glycosyltransferase involved in cell wall biosynthesis
MNILIVVHTFLPKYVGGTEVCAFELASELKKKGNKILILTTDPLINNKKINTTKNSYKDIDVITINKNIRKYKSFSETYKDDNTLKIFKKILNDFKPDIIHYHHLMHLSIDFVQIAKKANIPQVITLHDFWTQCLTHQRITTTGNLCTNFSVNKCSHCLSDILNSGPLINTTLSLKYFLKNKNKLKYLISAIKKIYYRSANKLFYLSNHDKYIKIVKSRNCGMKTILSQMDLVIFPTKFLSHEFLKWNSGISKNILSNDGINTKVFEKFKRLPNKTLRFGYIGSIIPTKGLDMVLRAWPKLAIGNYSLKIYGNLETDKKYANNILNLAKNLKNIKFYGNFSPENISKIYSEIDVLIVPSRWFENAPLVIRNALHTKTPIIGVNLGSISELIINNKNGLLYENEDLNGLIKQINHFILDKKLISKMKTNFPHQKSIEENAKELLDYFNKLIKK